MVAVAWRNAEEFVGQRLAELGAGQRGLVFVFDPEERLAWPEDGSAVVTDAVGNTWRLLAHRRNEMALRARFVRGHPTVIWVRPDAGAEDKAIDLTTLPDLVALADAFIDVSLAGMLETLLPGVPLPAEAAIWAPQAGADPPSFARALLRMLEHRKPPVSRRHVLAAAVCQAAPDVPAASAWLDDSDLPSLIASYARLLAFNQKPAFRAACGSVFRHVTSLLGTSAAWPELDEVAKIILSIPGQALIDYIYALAAARRLDYRDPAVLDNYKLTPAEVASALVEMRELGRLFMAVADRFNSNGELLAGLAQDAERRLDKPRLRTLQSLAANRARRWSAEPAAAVRLVMVATLAEEARPEAADLLALEAQPPVGAPRLAVASECMRRVGLALARYESLASQAPAASGLDLEVLIEAYVNGLATADYDLDHARRDLQRVATVLGPQAGLEARRAATALACGKQVAAYNSRLLALLRANLSSVLSSPLATPRWLLERAITALQQEPSRRVWLLVFDGLRWDLWERILRPALEQAGWHVQVEPGLAILPTETGICRRALLSGSWPAVGQTGSMAPSEEASARSLWQKAVGESDVVYRLRAESFDEGGIVTANTGRVNIWVFQTPDKQAHQADGVLADVANQFQTFLRHNVLPELQSVLAPGDLVFVAADHGFIRVSGERKYALSLPAERIQDRVASLAPGEETGEAPGVEVNWAGSGRYLVAGEDWAFVPLGGSAQSGGFRHGGASLQEMVVPLAILRLPTTKAGGLQLALTGPTDLPEDGLGEYVARIVNNGEETFRGKLLFETSLGAECTLPLVVAQGAQAERRRQIAGREGLEWVRVRLTAEGVTIEAKKVAVSVQLKPGIKLEGLEALDDDS